MGLGAWFQRKAEEQSVRNVEKGIHGVIQASLAVSGPEASQGAQATLLSAQRSLLQDIAVYNNMTVEQTLTKVGLPAIDAFRSHPKFAAVVVAVVSVFQSAANVTNQNLRPSVPPELLPFLDGVLFDPESGAPVT